MPDSNGAQSPSPSTADDGDVPMAVQKAADLRGSITSTAREPGISLDLVRLVGAEHDGQPGDQSSSKHGTVVPEHLGNMGDESGSQPDTRAKTFVGESWYASYVLSTSAAGPAELHRPIERRPKMFIPDAQGLGSGKPSAIRSKKVPPADLPPQHLTERLLEAYFKRFHVYCPILDRRSFLATVRDGTVSVVLLRCVLFVASIHCDPEVFHLMGYGTRFDAIDELFGKAVTSFDTDQESDRTTMVLSSYLLHYYFGKPSSYRDTLWWLATAIRSAQCMGYHRNTRQSSMPQRDKAQWKRVWWCLYIRDRQVCLSTGAPMVINDLDHDVEDLTIEDFPDESPETAQYIIAQASLNKAASSMFFRYCSPSQLHLSYNASTRLAARQAIQSILEEWYATCLCQGGHDNYHHLALTVKVCYHYYIINLQQRLQRLCPRPFADSDGSKMILEAAKNVSNLVEDSLLYWTPEHFPMIYISAVFTAMTAQVAECGVSGRNRQQLSQKLRPTLLSLKQFEQCYVLARWIRNMFMDIINRPSRPSNETTRTSEIPRIDSRMNELQPLAERDLHSLAQTNMTISDSGTVPATETLYPFSEERASHNIASHDFSFVCSGPYGQSASPTGYLIDTLIPNSPPNDFFPPLASFEGVNMTDFPSPSSMEYQSLHFLAELGLCGLSNPS
ncbi:Fungal specific transcription factor domain-containing protein [Cladophialophora immunda]|nr:Fungal specific transcription factor domain-containing protein [Cladophialophora immunda]